MSVPMLRTVILFWISRGHLTSLNFALSGLRVRAAIGRRPRRAPSRIGANGFFYQACAADSDLESISRADAMCASRYPSQSRTTGLNAPLCQQAHHAVLMSGAAFTPHFVRVTPSCYSSRTARQRLLIMHKLSLHNALHAGRLFGLLIVATVAALLALEWPGATAFAQTAERTTDPAVRPEFREPVTLASKEGVLEVRL